MSTKREKLRFVAKLVSDETKAPELADETDTSGVNSIVQKQH